MKKLILILLLVTPLAADEITKYELFDCGDLSFGFFWSKKEGPLFNIKDEDVYCTFRHKKDRFSKKDIYETLCGARIRIEVDPKGTALFSAVDAETNITVKECKRIKKVDTTKQ